ncbi:hypothetical protein ACPYO6_15815 [Georgenia sp. Z1344]|uniref:hypothetical protein n=1 Tax=Georgenia sp. Z1344 TaxID=3416706 RepID=UPI003CF2CB27
MISWSRGRPATDIAEHASADADRALAAARSLLGRDDLVLVPARDRTASSFRILVVGDTILTFPSRDLETDWHTAIARPPDDATVRVDLTYDDTAGLVELTYAGPDGERYVVLDEDDDDADLEDAYGMSRGAPLPFETPDLHRGGSRPGEFLAAASHWIFGRRVDDLDPLASAGHHIRIGNAPTTRPPTTTNDPSPEGPRAPTTPERPTNTTTTTQLPNSAKRAATRAQIAIARWSPLVIAVVLIVVGAIGGLVTDDLPTGLILGAVLAVLIGVPAWLLMRYLLRHEETKLGSRR